MVSLLIKPKLDQVFVVTRVRLGSLSPVPISKGNVRDKALVSALVTRVNRDQTHYTLYHLDWMEPT